MLKNRGLPPPETGNFYTPEDPRLAKFLKKIENHPKKGNYFSIKI